MVSDETTFPVRKTGFVIYKVYDHFILNSASDAISFELNSISWLVFSLCNGRISKKKIKELFRRAYSDIRNTDHDVAEIFESLSECGTIENLDTPLKIPSFIIRTGFCNFWEDFDNADNYFLEMLAEKFNILLTEPSDKNLDMLFYSVFPDANNNQNICNRENVLKIMVKFGKEEPDLTQCDYAFSDHTIENTDRHFYIPFNALYTDWKAARNENETCRLPKGYEKYRPENAANHFYNVLFSSSEYLEKFVEDSDSMGIELPLFQVRGTESSIVPASANTEALERKKLAIGMAAYDEFDGVYFTIQAIKFYHPEVIRDIEIIVIDNNPYSEASKSLKALVGWIKELRYIPFDEFTGTASRDIIFSEANSDYVLCIDSHVLIAPGAIRKLIDFFDCNPECMDLLQGPLVYDDLSNISTHFKPGWNAGMYGTWDVDERGKNPENEPFEIPMQGLGLFACRKDAWLGFNPRFRGFGGEEGYIHEKFRQAGKKTLLLPFLRWLHKFVRVSGTPYENVIKDRIRNYYIGFSELNMDTESISEHFAELMGEENFNKVDSEIKIELENPFLYFDAIYCINLDSATKRWSDMKKRFAKLGILERVRRFPAIETRESHHIGCTLSHRTIIEKAQKQNLKNVLVFEDDALCLENMLPLLKKSVEELEKKEWKVFHFGGYRWGIDFPKADGCEHLLHPCTELTCTQTVAYNHTVYSKILNDLPPDIDAMKEWLKTNRAIDQYLRSIKERYLAFPALTTQSLLMKQEGPVYLDKFL